MRSSKSRSRNKSNRQRSLGNIVNRVFDSSGPEGKVRGTPQQIIEKYLTLARDAQLSNDRVAEQSFLQHAEHYTRMLGEAQREQAERQQQFNNHRDEDGRDDQDGEGRNAQGQGGQGQGGHHNGNNRHGSQGNGGNGGHGNGGNGHQRDRELSDVPQPQVMDAPAPAPADASVESVSDAGSQDAANVQSAADARTVGQGLPPVIATDESATGPVETPETVTEAAPARKDAAKDGARPAPRRRAPRSNAAAPAGTAPTTAAAPRSRKKASSDAPKEPLSEGSSGK